MQTAYHFLRADMTAGSGNEKPWAIGEERTIKGRVVLCERGYHSAPTPGDALKYAPGLMLCEVQVSKPVAKDSEKQVSHTRQLVAAVDATSVLHELACRFAEDALPIFEQQYPTDTRPRMAIEAKRRWLRGEVTGVELDASRAAAYAAAMAAARDTKSQEYGAWANEALLRALKEGSTS